jgi:hypothetical protein
MTDLGARRRVEELRMVRRRVQTAGESLASTLWEGASDLLTRSRLPALGVADVRRRVERLLAGPARSVETLVKRVSPPSRDDVAAIAERLARVEERLGALERKSERVA